MAKAASDVAAGPAKVVVRTDTTDPKKIASLKAAPSGIVTAQAEDPKSFSSDDARYPGTIHPDGALRCIHECSFHQVKVAGKRRIRKQSPFAVGDLIHVGQPFYAEASRSACFEKCAADPNIPSKAVDGILDEAGKIAQAMSGPIKNA